MADTRAIHVRSYFCVGEFCAGLGDPSKPGEPHGLSCVEGHSQAVTIRLSQRQRASLERRELKGELSEIEQRVLIAARAPRGPR